MEAAERAVAVIAGGWVGNSTGSRLTYQQDPNNNSTSKADIAQGRRAQLIEHKPWSTVHMHLSQKREPFAVSAWRCPSVQDMHLFKQSAVQLG